MDRQTGGERVLEHKDSLLDNFFHACWLRTADVLSYFLGIVDAAICDDVCCFALGTIC